MTIPDAARIARNMPNPGPHVWVESDPDEPPSCSECGTWQGSKASLQPCPAGFVEEAEVSRVRDELERAYAAIDRVRAHIAIAEAGEGIYIDAGHTEVRAVETGLLTDALDGADRSVSTVRRIGKDDTWPPAVTDGLALSCGHCGQSTPFDYRVTDWFWDAWVEGDKRLGVVCLPCLNELSDGHDLAEALLEVQWTGTGHTVVLRPIARYEYEPRETK